MTNTLLAASTGLVAGIAFVIFFATFQPVTILSISNQDGDMIQAAKSTTVGKTFLVTYPYATIQVDNSNNFHASYYIGLPQ